MPAAVGIVGLTELRRGFKAIEHIDRRKELLVGFKAAADAVAQEAKSRVPVRSGRAKGSIRASASWQGGSAQGFVLGGKKSVPYYGWLDFGARTPRRGQPRSVGPWKKSGRGPSKGRFIYPAADSKATEVTRLVQAAAVHAIRAEDFTVT